jgi:hypothetical protein
VVGLKPPVGTGGVPAVLVLLLGVPRRDVSTLELCERRGVKRAGGELRPANESCHLKNGTKWVENKSDSHKVAFIRNSTHH